MSKRIIIKPDMSGEEFILEVAKECVKELSNEDEEYLIKHPYALNYHFTYGLYIRNKYLHNADYYSSSFFIEPDDMSEDILERIFSIIVPDYKCDTFTKKLFNSDQYGSLREAFYEKYGHYPVEVLDKYRDNFNLIYDAMIQDLFDNMPDDDETGYEIYEQFLEGARRLMTPVIEELEEKIKE